MEEVVDFSRAGTEDHQKLRVYTDSWASYNFLNSMPEVFHGKMNHDNGFFGKKKFHSNTIENRWS